MQWISPSSPSTLSRTDWGQKRAAVNYAGCLEFTRGNLGEDSPFLSTTYHTITCRTNSSLLIPARVTKPTNHSEPTEHHSANGLGCNLSDPRRVIYWSGRWSRPQVFDRTGSCIEHAPPVSQSSRSYLRGYLFSDGSQSFWAPRFSLVFPLLQVSLTSSLPPVNMS